MTTMTESGYADAVRQALDDLPQAAVTELMEGLDEHLAEVGVADLPSLVALLGAPEQYAAELRASAGLPTRVASRPSAPLPPPVPPPAAEQRHRFGVALRWSHVARIALVVIVVVTLLPLRGSRDLIDPLVVLVITVAVAAGACVLGWLARVADIPRPWAHVALAVLAALTLAVAATAGAAHHRGDVPQYPGVVATTVGGPPRSTPDVTGLPVQAAIDLARSQGLVPVVAGRTDPSSVVVRQEPPPGAFVLPGTEIQLITGQPRETLPTITTPPTRSPTTTG